LHHCLILLAELSQGMYTVQVCLQVNDWLLGV